MNKINLGSAHIQHDGNGWLVLLPTGEVKWVKKKAWVTTMLDAWQQKHTPADGIATLQRVWSM